MKKPFVLKLSLLACVALLIVSCEKRPAMAPEPDTELQSSVDVSFAAQVITDVEMICAFGGQLDLLPKFYMNAPGVAPPVVTRDPIAQYLYVSYNNTKCIDGRVRDGSIAMYYGYTNPNAKYIFDYEFEGKVSLLNYKVDKWSVDVKQPFIIKNLRTSAVFDPAKENLSWSITGDFLLKHPLDSAKNIHCNAELVKTLVNTADKNVYDARKISTITWSLGIAQYQGVMTGETSRTVPFKYVINDASPLVRDFTCYPDKVSGISSSPAVSSTLEEFHPITRGRVAFTTGTLYPRDLSYGNEQDTYHDVKNAPLSLSAQCDNKGIVTIKGISYPVDFAKEYK